MKGLQVMRYTIILAVFTIVFSVFAQQAEAQARALSKQAEDVIRSSAKSADDIADRIPEAQLRAFVKRSDESYLGLGKAGVRQLDDTAIAALRRGGGEQLIRRIDGLEGLERATALRVADGARIIRNSGGDIVRRSNIVREAGYDGMLLASKHGDAGVNALKAVEQAVRRGDLPPSALSDFARNMNRSHPKAFTKVWEGIIKPNWGKFLAAGTLGAFIVAPEEFVDAAGNLTLKGASAFGEFSTEVIFGIISGFVLGILTGVKNIATGQYALGFWLIVLAGLSWLGWKLYPRIQKLRS